VQALPENIGDCTGVSIISVEAGTFTSLPVSLGRLTGVRSFYMGNNNMWQGRPLPDFLGNLVKMFELSLYGLNLTGLPDTFAQFHKLWKLDLGLNEFTTLPWWIPQLISKHSLRLLLLGHNSLPNITWTEKVTGLRCIDPRYPSPSQQPWTCGIVCTGVPPPGVIDLSFDVGLVSGNISSQNLARGEVNYASYTNCTWTLQAPADFRIRIDVLHFDLEPYDAPRGHGCYDFVRFLEGGESSKRLLGYTEGNGVTHEGFSMCGGSPQARDRRDLHELVVGDHIDSRTNTMTIVFNSDGSGEHTGFVFRYSIWKER